MYDDLDCKLVEKLQQNGRSSYADLAHELGAAEGTVRKRVQRLLDKGIIKIVAVPNLPQLGYSFISIVGLDITVEDHFKVATKLAECPHVCFLAFVTGRFGLIAIIASRTREEYSEFWKGVVSPTPGILRTEGFICLEIVKGSGGMLDTTQLVRSLDICSLNRARKSEIRSSTRKLE